MNDIAQLNLDPGRYQPDNLATGEPHKLADGKNGEGKTSESKPRDNSRMGRLLVAAGKLDARQLELVMQHQQATGLRFGEAARDLGLASAEDITQVLANQFAFPHLSPGESQLSPALVAAFQPDGAEAEALRSLRTELLLRYFQVNPAHQHQQLSLALVGVEDARAIALTAANLAISFAQLGLPTLLVDANLRQPQVHQWFALDERRPGLSDLIAGRQRAQPAAIAPLKSLWVMHAGTQVPNPQELLANRQCGEYLSALSQRFEITLISTAPAADYSDAQLLAAQAGAALLVVNRDQTRLKPLAQLSANLQALGVRLLGAALRT